jgi:hypothetical protein
MVGACVDEAVRLVSLSREGKRVAVTEHSWFRYSSTCSPTPATRRSRAQRWT